MDLVSDILWTKFGIEEGEEEEEENALSCVYFIINVIKVKTIHLILENREKK